MTTITIPDRIVRYVRDALHSQLGMTAEDIGQATHEAAGHCQRCTPSRWSGWTAHARCLT